MKKQDAIQHFGGVPRLANELGITRQAVYLWGENVPKGRDFEIEVLTKGKLKARTEETKQKRIKKAQ